MLVTPNQGGDQAAREAALARAARAHASIDWPCVPRAREGLLELGGLRVLELDVAAIADGMELFRRISAGSLRAPYAAADGFIVGIREALRAAHRVVDPATGRPFCLGRLSPANLLFDAEGRTHLIGFGHNFPLEDEHGNPNALIPHTAAPELAMGGQASPEGDYVALLAFVRSHLSLVDRSDVMARILHGVANNSDKALIELVFWVESKVIGALPSARASMLESIEVADRIRAILGVTIDPEGFAAFAAGVLSDPRAEVIEPRAPGVGRLVVGPEAEWVQWNDDERRRLRGAMRRVFLALSEKQQLGSTEPVRSVDLIEVGWPDETMEHESALNRTYVTLNRLRKLFPEGVVERFDDGYRLRPDVAITHSIRHG